jgi:cell division septation protein DedD
MGEIHPLTDEDIAHRVGFADFASEHSQGQKSAPIRRLYAHWRKCNAEFFEGKMVEPYILLTDMAGTNLQGDFSPNSSFGGRGQIRLRYSILTGEYPYAKGGSLDPEGLARVMDDVLLHEMVHQYCEEVLGEPENSFRGHGPHFRDVCNRIGCMMDCGKVRTAKKRGKDMDLPSCAYWPTPVRPDGYDYYRGAWLESSTIGIPPDKIPVKRKVIKPAATPATVTAPATATASASGATADTPHPAAAPSSPSAAPNYPEAPAPVHPHESDTSTREEPRGDGGGVNLWDAEAAANASPVTFTPNSPPAGASDAENGEDSATPAPSQIIAGLDVAEWKALALEIGGLSREAQGAFCRLAAHHGFRVAQPA